MTIDPPGEKRTRNGFCTDAIGKTYGLNARDELSAKFAKRVVFVFT